MHELVVQIIGHTNTYKDYRLKICIFFSIIGLSFFVQMLDKASNDQKMFDPHIVIISHIIKIWEYQVVD